MPPKPKQGTSKKTEAKKKERVIEVRCKILYLPILQTTVKIIYNIYLKY